MSTDTPAPRRPLSADDLEGWGEYWLYNGEPERVRMRHGRAVFRFGVVRSTLEGLWAGPYAVTEIVEAGPS